MNDAGRTVDFSRTTITELMIPSYANFGGKIHGGILLSLMDKAAYACASRHAGTYCVTVSVDRVEFLKPVEVGELVSLHASINYVGRSSMIVGIRVEAQNVKSGIVRHTNSCYFTMVAKNDNDQPQVVPELVLQSHDDVRRFLEAMRRKEIRSKALVELDEAKSSLKVEDAMPLLSGERCLINLIA
ncbi:acyl-CoA thioesterase [Chryseolinea sp. T2]|uniref:acyl-CoA thioesterase n=1 Tax=Chryseolinea sp. T2 TaxID=3129255 RepID=UPI003077E0C0